MTAPMPSRPVGVLLRDWRRRRRLSQLDVSSRAAISTRHLSFLETGRARPSREMVLHLAEELEIPLRERNRLLVAAGFAPIYRETALDAPEMAAIRETLEQLLAGHEPFPAVIVDRGWNLVLANTSTAVLIEGLAGELVAPPLNVLRASLHPDGLAPRILNFAEWSGHLLSRLRREVTVTGDPELAALYDELSTYPGVSTSEHAHGLGGEPPAVVVPLRIRAGDAELAFF